MGQPHVIPPNQRHRDGASARLAPPAPPALARWPGRGTARPAEQFSVDLWTEIDGFPQNMAGAIAQTPDGYLWFGTEEGLVRFDGVRFHVYGPWNTPTLTTAWVTALHVDDDGTLWVGTGGG